MKISSDCRISGDFRSLTLLCDLEVSVQLFPKLIISVFISSYQKKLHLLLLVIYVSEGPDLMELFTELFLEKSIFEQITAFVFGFMQIDHLYDTQMSLNVSWSKALRFFSNTVPSFKSQTVCYPGFSFARFHRQFTSKMNEESISKTLNAAKLRMKTLGLIGCDNIEPDNNRRHKTRQNWQAPMPIQYHHFNPLNSNHNQHLICATKTPQLCYKLESSSLRSIRFLLGLWYLSWRPWWWESTVNRLSFYPGLLLYKIIIDSEKKKKEKSLLGDLLWRGL